MAADGEERDGRESRYIYATADRYKQQLHEGSPLLHPSLLTPRSALLRGRQRQRQSQRQRRRSSVKNLLRHFSAVEDSEDEEDHIAFTTSLFGFDPTLLISVALGLVSGTLYGFGRYSRDIKDVLNLSQTQVSALGILLDTGNYIGHPVTGYVYDVHGPRISCVAAAGIVFGSYACIHLVVNDNTNTNIDDDDSSDAGTLTSVHWLLLALGFTLVGFGSGLGYIAALGTTAKKFSGTEQSGRAVGFVAAGYGLSSTLVGITYDVCGLRWFFLLWAVLVAIVNCLGAFLFPPARRSGYIEIIEENGAIAGGNTEDIESFRWTTWRKCSFWMIFYSFACVAGCGLFVINNVSTMVESIGGEDSLAGALVYLLSVCSCGGRIVIGVVADTGIAKLTLFRTAALIMAISLLLSAAASPSSSQALLVATVALGASSYGALWVIIVGLLSDMYGKDHFGKDYGVIALGPALSGMVFNSYSAWVYEANIDDADDLSVCIGISCYRKSFLMTALAAMTGLLLLFVIGHAKPDHQ